MKDYCATTKGWAFFIEFIEPVDSSLGIEVDFLAIDTIRETVFAVELASFSCLEIDY